MTVTEIKQETENEELADLTWLGSVITDNLFRFVGNYIERTRHYSGMKDYLNEIKTDYLKAKKLILADRNYLKDFWPHRLSVLRMRAMLFFDREMIGIIDEFRKERGY